MVHDWPEHGPGRLTLEDLYQMFKARLAEETQPDEAAEVPSYTALGYTGQGPLPKCDACGHAALAHDPPNYGRCPSVKSNEPSACNCPSGRTTAHLPECPSLRASDSWERHQAFLVQAFKDLRQADELELRGRSEKSNNPSACKCKFERRVDSFHATIDPNCPTHGQPLFGEPSLNREAQ